MIEARLEVQDPRCWVCALPADASLHVRVVARSDLSRGVRELVECTLPAVRSSEFEDILSRLPGVSQAQLWEPAPDKLIAVVDSVGCRACRACSRSGVLLTRIAYEGGVLHWSLVARGEYDLKGLVDRLRTKQCIVAISRIGRPSVQEGLSPRQHEILSSAARMGYFDIPRRVRLADLSGEFGVSRQAVMEALRRGEKTLLSWGV